MSGEPEPSEERRRMRRAVRAVRREGRKAAVIVATVDATLALLATTLLLRVVAVVPESMPLPDALVSLAAAAGASLGDVTVHGAVYVGLGAFVVVFAVDVARQLRKPLVERFERANPEVAEALRTARDAVEDGADTAMARRLYDDVLTRLRETSSLGLVDARRLGVAVVLLVAIAVGNVAVVASDVQVTIDGDGGGGGGDTARPNDYGGLQDPDSVLGDPSDVGTGGDDLNASIPTSGDGGEGNVSGAPSAYESSGFGGDAAVESQQAGFDEAERLEDAELIRDYNLRIRQTDDDD